MTSRRGITLGFELAAIGVGVFLGLLADDWRDRKVQRGEGLDALELVRSDLRSDSVELEGTRRSLLARAEVAPWLLRNERRTGAPDSAMVIVTSVLTLPRYQRIRPAYITLRGAGRLDRIESPVLRSALVEYFERDQEQFVQELSDWLYVREELIADLNRYTVYSGSDSIARVWPQAPDLSASIDWVGLVGDRVAKSKAVRYSALAVVAARRAEDLLEANSELSRAIDEELAGR